MSIWVICRQNTKAIALRLPKLCSFSSLFNLQSKSININFGQFSPKYQGYSLTFCPNWLIFITFQSSIKINQFQFGYFSPKYQGYSLTICPTLAHFHHFSMCNQNQSISICVMCRQNTKAIALLFAQNWAHFHQFSMCNQNQSISICVMCRQNTKAIALLFAQNWLIFITFQCAIKINQFQFASCVAKIPRL